VEAFHHPVGLWVVGRSLVVLEEVNWAPQSYVMTAGTPNLLTHP
jgi:hypothetical protein